MEICENCIHGNSCDIQRKKAVANLNICGTFIDKTIVEEKIKSYVNSSDCLKCIHAPVCARHMGGMNLMKCEDYKENLIAFWKTRENKNDYLWVECSNCGFRIENYNAVNTGKSSTDIIGYKWKACPKCGAHMIFRKD